jgi:hypothetical protein
MKRRTHAQWLSLIQEFEQSGLTQSKFCAQHNLNPKYFSLRRAELKAQEGPSAFVQAVSADTQNGERVTIEYGKVEIHLPASATHAIAHLVKALVA